eukprot:s3520_g6.t1
MAEQEFKILDGVRRGASSGEMLTGKQVVRPLRFFVSEASQHSIACIMISGADLTCSESQDSALRMVAALRSVVESRLEELKKDKATRVACVPDEAFADPLETVQTFERTNQELFLDECKVDNYQMATINAWISHRVGKEKMPKVRTASDELLAALGRVPPGNRPAIDAIAVGWGLPVTAAAKIGERSLCNLIATGYVLGQE